MTVKRYNIYKRGPKGKRSRVDAVLNVDTRTAIKQINRLKQAIDEIEWRDFERIVTLTTELQRLEAVGFLGHVCPEEPAEVSFKKAHGFYPDFELYDQRNKLIKVINGLRIQLGEVNRQIERNQRRKRE